MNIDMFDIVELLKDIPEDGLKKGDSGVIVHIHGKHEAYEVEFGDDLLVVTLEPEEIKFLRDGYSWKKAYKKAS